MNFLLECLSLSSFGKVLAPAKFVKRCPIFLFATCCLLLSGCQRPYSAATYAKDNPEQLYATICHDHKRTINVKAEDWEEHRAHGDYRGPCRERGIAGPATPVEVAHSATGYRDREAKLRASREAYELRLAAQRFQQDSLQQSAQ